MHKFSTFWGQRLNLRHCLMLGLICAAWPAHTPSPESKGRTPANYVPNDDVIVVPVNAEMSFYERHFLYDAKFSERSQIQQRIKLWQENELMAQRHGVDTQSSSSPYYIPDSEDKMKWMQRSYFRYLQKKGEDPFKREGQEMIREWTADDEVDSIDEMEANFRSGAKKDSTTRSLLDRPLIKAFRERQVAKTKKFNFNFQPRVEQGLIILGMTGPIFDARAWVAANGEPEVKAERKIASTGTRFMVNYFAHSGRYLSSVDQSLMYPGLKARFTSTWDPDQLAPERANERRYQLMYSTGF